MTWNSARPGLGSVRQGWAWSGVARDPLGQKEETMTKEHIETLVMKLNGCHVGGVEISELRKLVPSDLPDTTWELVLWKAIQLMRKHHHIEFINRNGVLTVAKPEQAVDKGVRFRRVGMKKMARALAVLEIIEADKLNESYKGILERARARGGRMYMAALTELKSRKKDPTEFSNPVREPSLRRLTK